MQNPGNLGTIIRLADWFGITDIVCSEASADCFNPKVVQATMGAILRVRVHYTDLAALLSKAAALGLPVCGTFLEGANKMCIRDRCRGVDLMYHEATYAAAEQRSARDRGHSTTTDAAKAALKAGARRLVIGHYSSRYKDETPLVEEARTLFAESYPATEGTTYTIEKQR